MTRKKDIVVVELTETQWRENGRSIFGNDRMDWRFICPMCNRIAGVQDFIDAGSPAPTSDVTQDCISIYLKGQWRCSFTTREMMPLHKTEVVMANGERHRVFEFATPEQVAEYVKPEIDIVKPAEENDATEQTSSNA